MLTNEDLISIRGGSITATMLNAFSRAIDTILNLGQIVGSSIRRAFSKNYCSLK